MRSVLAALAASVFLSVLASAALVSSCSPNRPFGSPVAIVGMDLEGHRYIVATSKGRVGGITHSAGCEGCR